MHQSLPSGYEYNGQLGICYKLHKYPMDWFDAMRTCQTENAKLATLSMEGEVKVALQMMKDNLPKTNSSNVYHIGINDIFHTDFFRTLKGTILIIQYVEWSLI
jgi:hypothetical protein